MKSLKIFLVIIGLFVMVGNTVNAEEINKEDELKLEIEAIIQNEFPQKNIVSIVWELTQKHEDYATFVVVDDFDNNFKVNVKYQNFDNEQIKLITKLIDQREKESRKYENIEFSLKFILGMGIFVFVLFLLIFLARG